MADVTAGQRLHSAVCATEVIVVRAPDAPVDLSCGGHPMTIKAPKPLSASD